MTGIFAGLGIDIAQEVKAGLESAGGVLTGTFVKYTRGARTPGNVAGGTNRTSVSYAVQGFLDNRTIVRLDGTLVTTTAQAVTLVGASLPPGVVPDSGDELIFEGEVFTVIELIERDPAAAVYTYSVQS